MNQWKLTIAANGAHYATIVLPDYLTEDDAKHKARFFARALRDAHPVANWECRLTCWLTSGREVEF